LGANREIIAAEVMKPSPQAISMTASVQEAAARMTQELVSWLPVMGPTGLVGVVSASDIVRRPALQGKPLAECRVSEIMTLGIVCCRRSDTVTAALRLMNRRLVYQLVVLDASGRLTGVVTVHDLIRGILTPESMED
jgi:CBS domain-containing protein